MELAGADGGVEMHEDGVSERPPAGQQRKAPQVLDGSVADFGSAKSTTDGTGGNSLQCSFQFAMGPA